MTTRSGFTRGGVHFRQTLTTRMGSPRLCCFVDGKPVSAAAFQAALAAARASSLHAEYGRGSIEAAIEADQQGEPC